MPIWFSKLFDSASALTVQTSHVPSEKYACIKCSSESASSSMSNDNVLPRTAFPSTKPLMHWIFSNILYGAALTVPCIIPSSITSTISIAVILFFMALLSSFPELMAFYTSILQEYSSLHYTPSQKRTHHPQVISPPLHKKTAAAPTSWMDTAAAHFFSPVVNLVVSWS